MTATAEPPTTATEVLEPRPLDRPPLDRAEGVELLGGVHGSGYKEGAALVRRGDGQMVHLGPLMYAVLEAVDGRRDASQVADAASERLGRTLGEEHVARIAQKLAEQGLLAGSEQQAPPKRNPLLALRWKVLVTNPQITRRLTAPFTFLFRPWVMWPVLACFVGVFWFVLFHKGVASATAEAFHDPGLLLLVFALAVASAGFHELGHAAACRYGGATPGGMGMGLYLVWPAFYTDVTDTYRLPRRDRLRVDLGGLYFNAVVAVVTMAIWLAWRQDALLLLIALQVLQMVKQLSPVIRADGYHILSDATGVPDLFSHMGPTMRRLFPGHRHEPSALTGRARLLVTLWVLIVVPVLFSLSLGAILLLPKLATSAWESGRVIVTAVPHDASEGKFLDLGASIVRLLALTLPVLGSLLVAQKITRTMGGKAHKWSAGSPARRAIVIAAAAGVCALLAWAWWPAGQYQPVRASDNGTIGGLVRMTYSPATVARPTAEPAMVQIPPGRHLALSMIPVGGATRQHPALFVISGRKGSPPIAIVSYSTPPPGGASGGAGGTSGGASGTGGASGGAGGVTNTAGAGNPTATGTSTATTSTSTTAEASAFPFTLPSAPGPGGTQALAENTTNGGVTYDVAYSVVTISGGAPVTNTNSAYALAHCQGCTTVAVSFQVILIVGHSKYIAPINAAGAINYDCPACVTTAIADQLVVTLSAQPSAALLAKLETALKQLNALPALGAGGTPQAVASQVGAVQQQIDTALDDSGLPTQPITTGTTTTGTTNTTNTPSSTTTTPAPTATQTEQQTTSTAPAQSTIPATAPATTPSTSTSTTTTTAATTPSTTPSTTGTTSTSTTAAPAG